MTQLTIGTNTKVTLNFSLALEDGTPVDSNFGQPPASFTVGDGNILEGFERHLMGLKAGETREFLVPPEDGFGQPNPNNIQTVKRSSFGDDELVEGLVCTFGAAEGGDVPGVIRAIDEDTVTVDFNHPLAGRSIIFTVAIHSVDPAEVH